jgi:hypothetical protein
VCTGILLVVLLASSLARPNYFPGLQYDAEIDHEPPYQCFAFPNCAGYIKNVYSKHECCQHVIGGKGFWDFVTCYKWLVERDQSLKLISLLCSCIIMI